MKEGERVPFFPKLRVRIKDNNNSLHGKFRCFLFSFSNKFPDVLYIYPCDTHTASLSYLWSKLMKPLPCSKICANILNGSKMIVIVRINMAGCIQREKNNRNNYAVHVEQSAMAMHSPET